MVGSKVTITNGLAQAVGDLARQHPDCSVEIVYDDERAEPLWEVNLDAGRYGFRYIVNDETQEVVEAPFVTATGRVLTNEDIERLADEAERDRHLRPPPDFWRTVPCGHPPDPVAWVNPQGHAICHCGSALIPAHAFAHLELPDGMIGFDRCGKCGCTVAIPKTEAN